MPKYFFPQTVAVAVVLFSVVACERNTTKSQLPKKDEPALEIAKSKVPGRESLSPKELTHRAEQIALTQEELADYAGKHFKPSRVQNYFKGMDMVAGYRGAPLGEDAWPQQLLDLQPKDQIGKVELVDPIPLPFELKPEERNKDTEQLEKEVFGRNAWLIWCGGNEGFWDWLATDEFGFIDLLKLIDSRQRSRRFEDGGMINEPHMAQATTASPDEFGLWLDSPVDDKVRTWRKDYIKEAFGGSIDNWQKSMATHRGVAYGPGDSYKDGVTAGGTPAYGASASYSSSGTNRDYAAGKSDDNGYLTPMNAKAYDDGVPPPAIYGMSSGVVGLRLFPNPKFVNDPEAQKRWDPVRYYTDPAYYNDPNLVRPYRVGMSCAFCHASWHPLNPPRDRNSPEWANISGSIGSQYLRVRATFGNLLKPDSLIYHALDSQPPGTIDTSLIASDNINNTNTMNAIWGVPARVVRSFELPREKLSAASFSQPSLWGNPDGLQKNHLWAQDTVYSGHLAFANKFGFTDKLVVSNDPAKGNPRYVPRVLLDGSDSVGAWVALARVYLNIGTHWEQWNTLHTPVVGFTKQKPFKIEDSRSSSVYWHATELRVAALRDYFLKVTPSMRLLTAVDTSGRLPSASAPAAKTDGKPAAPAAAHPRLAPIDVEALHTLADSGSVDLTALEASLHPSGWKNPIQKDKKEATFQLLLAKEKATHIDVSKLAHGRRVFARNCIACHSSIQPESDWAKTLVDTKNTFGKDLLDLAGNTAALEKLEKPFAGWWKELTIKEEAFAKKQALPDAKAKADALLAEWQSIQAEDDALRAKEWPILVLLAQARAADARKANFALWEKTNELWDHDPGQWLRDANSDYERWALAVVENPQFWTLNFLSSDFRIPVNYVRTNSARAMATNALTGNMWEDYSSESFRTLPSVGVIDFYNAYPWKDGGKQREQIFGKQDPYPFTQRSDGNQTYLPAHAVPSGVPARGGGPGFYRVPSLISVWATAPLLHDNSLGLFNNDPTVDGRLLAFNDAIHKLLWPEERLKSSSYNQATPERLVKDHGLIWRAPEEIYVTVPAKFAVALGNRVPFVMRIGAHLHKWFGFIIDSRFARAYPWAPTAILLLVAVILLWVQRGRWVRYAGYISLVLGLFLGLVIYYGGGLLGDLRVGPFPKGTPINLLLNTNPDADPAKVKKVLDHTIAKLGEIRSKHLSDERAIKVMEEEIAPALMEVSKCPDFVMDEGHYYPWFESMTDEDKEALIELLKTF